MKREHTRKFAELAIILLSTIMLTGCGAKLAGDNSNQSAPASSQPSQPTATNTDDNSATLAKYEGILQTARDLTADKKYDDSNKALNTMSVTELASDDFAAVKEAADNLRAENTAGITAATEAKAAKKATKAKNAKKSAAPKQTAPAVSSNRSSFAGWEEWTGEYYFWDGGYSRHQENISFDSNGDVYQTSDNANYSGVASITSSSATGILSYDVTGIEPENQYFPTKTINADVKITVTWNNGGGTQVFYGYTSYSGSKVLTDGKAHGDGVNEVWEMSVGG